MFVAPRPMIDDDPLFAVRAACMAVIGLLVGMLLKSPMASLFPVLMFSLLVSNRKAFDFTRVIAAPVMFSGMLWLMSFIVMALQGVPLTLMLVVTLFFFAAFYLIQRTGNALGMLIIIAMMMMTLMGTTSYQAMETLRGEMTKAAFATALFTPFLYAVLPPRTREKAVDVPTPSFKYGWEIRAAVRSVVLLGYTVFLLTIIDVSNLMLAISGMYVLVHSTRASVLGEAWQRTFGSLLGGCLALCVLSLIQVSSHLVVVGGLIFIATLWPATRMMTSKAPYRIYQDAATIMLSIVAGGLATTEPTYAFMQRAGLTLVGTLAAAFAVLILDTLLVKPVKEPLPV